MPNLAPTELSHAHKPASGILSTSQTLAGHADRDREHEIINAAQAQTKEWRKHAGEVLATSAKAAAASVSKSSSSSSEKGGSSSSKLKK